MKNTMLRGVGIFTVLLFMLSAVPVTEAQLNQACANAVKPSITGEGISIDQQTITPITGLATVTAKFRYKVDAQGTSVTQVPIEFSVSVDKSWIDATMSSNAAFVAVSQNAETNEVLTVQVQVAVSQDAPAFEKGNIKVTAVGGEGTCVPVSNSLTQELKVQAGFYENYQARFDQAIWKTGQNERIQIPLIVDNFGNGPIRVTFQTGEGTSGKLNLALPGPQIVESTRTGGETNKLTIPIDVQTPFKNGYENRRDQLNLLIKGTYAFDTNQKLQDLQLSAVVQTQGVYVPGFDAVTMVGAALGAALVARRLRS